MMYILSIVTKKRTTTSIHIAVFKHQQNYTCSFGGANNEVLIIQI